MVVVIGQLPLASGAEPSGHVVVSVCCLVGDSDTGGGEVAPEGGRAVEGGCAGPTSGGFSVVRNT